MRAWLMGEWRLARVIDDARAGRQGRMTGTLTFTPDADGLVCDESGVLVIGDQTYPARRRTLWRFDAARVIVRFADGRPFHDWAPDAPRAVHPCGADLYRVAYDFGPEAWSSTWQVTGPAKAYTMTSHHSRPAAGDGT